jgi:hypothetical protein
MWGLLGGRPWPLVVGGLAGCSTASSGPPSVVAEPGADGGGGCAGCPVVLASSGCCGGNIAADDTAVYWTGVGVCDSDGGDCAGTVSKVPLDSGAIIALASGQNNPAGIALDATHAYWANSGSACVADAGPCSGAILSVPLAGGEITTLASQLDAPIRIAVDATGVYWSNRGRTCTTDAGLSMSCGGSIMTIPVQGGAPTTLASGLNGDPWAITVDQDNVYWTNFDDGTVMKVPRLGGITTTLASGQLQPSSIGTDATSVYWANTDDVRKLPLMGGPITILAAGGGTGIAVDPSGVYWPNPFAGTVQKVALDGGAIHTLSKGQDFSDIALTATNVYALSFLSGSVFKISK